MASFDDADAVAVAGTEGDLGQQLGMVEAAEGAFGDEEQAPDQGGGVGDLLVAFAGVGAQTDGGEGRFDRVGGAQVFPVLAGEVVEGHHPRPVAPQGVGGGGMLRAVALNEEIAEPLGLGARGGVGHLAQQLPRLGLQAPRQAVEDVADLVIPAALLGDLGEDVGHGGPDAEVAVGDEEPRQLQAPLAQTP